MGALAAKPEGLRKQRFLHSRRSVEMTLLKSVIPSEAEGSHAHGAKGVARPLRAFLLRLYSLPPLRLARVKSKNRPKLAILVYINPIFPFSCVQCERAVKLLLRNRCFEAGPAKRGKLSACIFTAPLFSPAPSSCTGHFEKSPKKRPIRFT